MDRVLIDALEHGDIEAAQRFIESEDDPARVLAMYHGAIRHLYWSCKDITMIVRLGGAALAFGAELTDDKLLGLLKSVAYDLGSFCWSGWDEPGIEIEDDTRLFGAAAAGLNLELGERLGRPPRAIANAHWLVGAHLLAAGNRDAAIRSFEASASLAHTAEDRASELLAEGYARIARREHPDLEELASLEHGAELTEQLVTAQRLYA